MNGAAARRAHRGGARHRAASRGRASLAVVDGAGVRMVVHVAQRASSRRCASTSTARPSSATSSCARPISPRGARCSGSTSRLPRAHRALPRAARVPDGDRDDRVARDRRPDARAGHRRRRPRRSARPPARVVLRRSARTAPRPQRRSLAPSSTATASPSDERADESALDAADTAMDARLRALGHHKAVALARPRLRQRPRHAPRPRRRRPALRAPLRGERALRRDRAHRRPRPRRRDRPRAGPPRPEGEGLLRQARLPRRRGHARERAAADGRSRSTSLVFHIVENPRVKVAQRARTRASSSTR